MPEKTAMKYLEDIRDYSKKAIDYLNNITYEECIFRSQLDTHSENYWTVISKKTFKFFWNVFLTVNPFFVVNFSLN